MPNLLPVLKTMSSRMFIMMPKNTTLLEVHFVAWKWRKTMPGMTVEVGIEKIIIKHLCYETKDEVSNWI